MVYVISDIDHELLIKNISTVLNKNKFGLPFLFQTEEEASEADRAAVTDDGESNSSSSADRSAEPEMKQGKCRVLCKHWQPEKIAV